MENASEQYGASNGFTVSLRPEESMSERPRSSESRTGTASQRLMADAIESSEFTNEFVSGIPVIRQGSGLKISYESAMEVLGFSGNQE